MTHWSEQHWADNHWSQPHWVSVEDVDINIPVCVHLSVRNAINFSVSLTPKMDVRNRIAPALYVEASEKPCP